ncbi:hypothetical protein IGI39_003484 [Enterococcus sp. AZ135]|uniref:MerR family transcriptional regulator n=1 Tax=unclassified Enterococcus TaxID=2608891 RepID=UPI003F226AAC
MVYTIKQVAELSGVSTRTLRFYDERALLKPAFLSESGYRMYTEKEIDRLQQILLYRSVGVPLKTIRELIDRPAEKIQQTLMDQRVEVVRKQKELDRLLKILDDTLLYYKGEIEMTNREKFEAFKQKSLLENEEKYGEEIREKYGKEAVEDSNQKWIEMSEFDYQKMEEVETTLFGKLTQYMKDGDISRPLAEEIFDLHRLWLQFSWKKYTKEAHRGLSEMYLADERFTQYYNEKCGIGATEALYQIIQYYTK